MTTAHARSGPFAYRWEVAVVGPGQSVAVGQAGGHCQFAAGGAMMAGAALSP
jgi:hypothetical protein